MLLAAKANVNAKDKYGKGPLMWAAAAGNEKLAQLLCKHGADLHATDRLGRTPLHYAVHPRGSDSVVGLLLEHGADPHAVDGEGRTPLTMAVDPQYTE